MDQRRRQLGTAGERYAERRLRQLGWTILERNWRGSSGEIDLIALADDTLVFVEVKTRRGQVRGAAEEAVNPRKAARLLALGEEYVANHHQHEGRFWRVDLMAVTIDSSGTVERLNHIENAYSADR